MAQSQVIILKVMVNEIELKIQSSNWRALSILNLILKRKTKLTSFHNMPLYDDSAFVFPPPSNWNASFSWLLDKTLSKPYSNAASSKLCSSKLWWDTNDGTIAPYVLHDMDVIHLKIPTFTYKLLLWKRVKLPSNQATQSNSQFIGNS